MPAPLPRARMLAVLAATALVAGSFAAAAPASADVRRMSVPAARPAWATAAADQGAVAAATSVDLELALKLPDETAARDFALAVSTPGDPQYRRFLAPQAWIDRFAPTQSTVDTVVAAVQAAGLTATYIPKSRLFLQLSGSAAQVDAFLRTSLHTYDVDGEDRLAAATGASLPQQVARAVSAVTFSHPRIVHGPRAEAKRATVSKCSAWWGQHRVRLAKPAYGKSSASTPLCGYTAKQLRALTGVAGSGLDGAGQTVAVIGGFGAPSMRRDLATWSQRNGLPAADYTEVLPTTSEESFGCTAADWQGEQALDLETIHAVAPKARLVYVGAGDCGAGFDVAMSKVLDDGLATIVSNSWGATALDSLAGSDMVDDAARQSMSVMLHQQLQAAGQGIGLYFASGDFGDDSAVLGMKAVDFPASSPFVTAVGGTAVGLDRAGKRVFTRAWGENVALLSSKAKRWSPSLPGYFAGGAGGGASSLFAAPAYQQGVVPASLSKGMRTSTDVSALAASSTGVAVGFRPMGGSYRTVAVGGTSLATPIVAAQVALAQQASGRTLGFLNPALYSLARTSPAVFRDVQAGASSAIVAQRARSSTMLITLDRDSSLKARPGYDLPTGLGELKPSALRALGRL